MLIRVEHDVIFMDQWCEVGDIEMGAYKGFIVSVASAAPGGNTTHVQIHIKQIMSQLWFCLPQLHFDVNKD